MHCKNWESTSLHNELKNKNVGVFGLKTSSNLVSMGHQHFCLQSINADLNSRLRCDYISDSFDLGVV